MQAIDGDPWRVIRRALTQMGTQKESFVELTERINRTTGGVSVYPFTSSVKGSPEPVAFLMVSAPRVGTSETPIPYTYRVDCSRIENQ